MKRVLAAALVVPAALLALVLLIVVSAAGSLTACPAERALTVGSGGTGSLGGIAGTGVSEGKLEAVLASPLAGSGLESGRYSATAYGPPWGGIQGSGVATAGGLKLERGSPPLYLVATDPSVIPLGQLVYIWPNPHGWRGPYLAADTGGAIRGRRIDFYEWRGRAEQLRWGRREVDLSARPIAGRGKAPVGLSPQPACPAGEAGPIPSGEGEVEAAAGANASARPLRPELLAYARRGAELAGRRLVITTGTAHSQFTASGNVSDHWFGLGADFGSVANGFSIGGRGGTAIATALIEAAGVSRSRARGAATAGRWWSGCFRGWRVQVGWLVPDHFDHVHVGLREGC